MKWLLISLLCLSCAGCGLAAAPCRVTSAVIKIVPVVGGVAAAPIPDPWTPLSAGRS